MKLTVADWRQRAHECMLAAQATSNSQSQLQWLVLYEAWLKFADLRENGQYVFIEKPPSDRAPTSVDRADSAAVERGNKLRATLMLDTNNDATQ